VADKYLYNNAGALTEKAAIATSAGATDAGKIVALDSAGRLDTSVMPSGIGADTEVIPASEALSAGDFVNVHNSTGPKVRKADASTAGKEAVGFVLAAVSSGANATVYFEGRNNQVSSVTPGPVYLSDTVPGGFTSTPPSGTGKVVQRLGVGTTTTSINFEPQPEIVLA
jgi:hypothetical protein